MGAWRTRLAYRRRADQTVTRMRKMMIVCWHSRISFLGASGTIVVVSFLWCWTDIVSCHGGVSSFDCPNWAGIHPQGRNEEGDGEGGGGKETGMENKLRNGQIVEFSGSGLGSKALGTGRPRVPAACSIRNRTWLA